MAVTTPLSKSTSSTISSSTLKNVNSHQTTSTVSSLIEANLSTCSTILNLLSSNPVASTSSNTKSSSSATTTTLTSDMSSVPITSIRNDHLILISHLKKSITNLSLAFKPPVTESTLEAVYKLILEQLKKIKFGTECLVVKNNHGRKGRGFLEKELRASTEDIIEVISNYLKATQQIYESTFSSSSSSTLTNTKNRRDQLLVQTSIVWNTIDKSLFVPSPSTSTVTGKQKSNSIGLVCHGISETELKALGKRWKGIVEVIDDCLEEVKELENEPLKEGDPEDDEDEEEEDEDDFRSSHPLTELERQRAKATHFLIRIARLLINRLVTTTLTTSSSSSIPKGFETDSFQLDSNDLIDQISSTADDLAGALETPQDPTEVSETLQQFIEHVDGLIECVLKVVDQDDSIKEEEVGKETKWFEMCRLQLKGAEKRLLELLV